MLMTSGEDLAVAGSDGVPYLVYSYRNGNPTAMLESFSLVM